MKTFKKNPYACNLCNKDFSIPKLLVRHVNTAHDSSSSGNTKKSQPELKHKKNNQTIRKNQIELARGQKPVTTVKKTKDSMMLDQQKYTNGKDTKISGPMGPSINYVVSVGGRGVVPKTIDPF